MPRFAEDQLDHSTLILADQMTRVAAKNVGTGQFVIGDIKVRPAVKEEFSQSDHVGVYLQVYNLGINEQTHKPDATIEYNIRKGDDTVFSHKETSADLERAARQITLEKVLHLKTLAPGEYKLTVTIIDHVKRQTRSPSARFRVVE